MPTPRRSPRTLFLVRSKFGDTLAAWPAIQAYAERHPDEEIWFAVRRNYALFFAAEARIRLLPFASSWQLFAGILRLRLTGGIAKLAVLWATGKAVARAARLSGATRRAYLDRRFGKAFTDHAAALPDDSIADPAWRVARCLDAGLPRPQRLDLLGLRARRSATPQAIALVPVADEARRLLDGEALAMLAAAARERFPGAPLWLLGNPDDRALQPLLANLPEGVSLKPFPGLDDLVEALVHTRHLLTTDTGVYHLAAAMGVPVTVFQGPTQPQRTVLPDQQNARAERLPQLGERHCEVKECTTPHCLWQAVARWSGQERPCPRGALPPGCLMLSGSQDIPLP